MNPKIGKLNPGVYPSETITGKPYQKTEYDPPPAIVHTLVDDYVAIGDPFPPRDFDAEATVNALKVELAPKSAVASVKKSTPTEG